jgi:hypothetical protein
MSALFFAEAQRQAVTPVDAPQQVAQNPLFSECGEVAKKAASDIGLPVPAPFIAIRELEAHVAETHLLMQLARARYRGSKSLQDATEAAEWATAKAAAESALLAARRALAKADELTMGGEWVDELGAR